MAKMLMATEAGGWWYCCGAHKAKIKRRVRRAARAKEDREWRRGLGGI